MPASTAPAGLPTPPEHGGGEGRQQQVPAHLRHHYGAQPEHDAADRAAHADQQPERDHHRAGADAAGAGQFRVVGDRPHAASDRGEEQHREHAAARSRPRRPRQATGPSAGCARRRTPGRGRSGTRKDCWSKPTAEGQHAAEQEGEPDGGDQRRHQRARRGSGGTPARRTPATRRATAAHRDEDAGHERPGTALPRDPGIGAKRHEIAGRRIGEPRHREAQRHGQRRQCRSAGPGAAR